MKTQTVSPVAAVRIERPARAGGCPTSGPLSGIWVGTTPGRTVSPDGAGTLEEATEPPERDAERKRDTISAVALRRIGELLLDRSTGAERRWIRIDARSRGRSGAKDRPGTARHLTADRHGLGMSPRGDLACWMFATSAPRPRQPLGSGVKYYTRSARSLPPKSPGLLGLSHRCEARAGLDRGGPWRRCCPRDPLLSCAGALGSRHFQGICASCSPPACP